MISTYTHTHTHTRCPRVMMIIIIIIRLWLCVLPHSVRRGFKAHSNSATTRRYYYQKTNSGRRIARAGRCCRRRYKIIIIIVSIFVRNGILRNIYLLDGVVCACVCVCKSNNNVKTYTTCRTVGIWRIIYIIKAPVKNTKKAWVGQTFLNRRLKRNRETRDLRSVLSLWAYEKFSTRLITIPHTSVRSFSSFFHKTIRSTKSPL